MFGQFTKPGHFFKSPRCKTGGPLRTFTYLPENIWGTTGCVTEGVFVAKVLPEALNSSAGVGSHTERDVN